MFDIGGFQLPGRFIALQTRVLSIDQGSSYSSVLLRFFTRRRCADGQHFVHPPSKGPAMKQNTTSNTVHEAFPYLRVRDAARAIDYYRDVFGAELRLRLDEKGTGRIGHAELVI